MQILKHMFYKIGVFFLILAFASSSFAYSLKSNSDWQEYKSTHFIVYHHPNIPNKYIRKFTRKCERYYHLITERLGFNRFDFWLWEDRAKIFIYENREKYIKATGRPQWSGASVHLKKKYINTFYFHEDFFTTILPHELAHIILREFIGLKAQVPLWFDEGVACANEKDNYLKYLLFAKALVARQIYIPIPELEKLSRREVKFPSIFYSTAATLIIFLLEDYGKSNFVELCKMLKEGNGFYQAMNKVYGIKDAGQMNKELLAYLQNKSYEDVVGRKNFSLEW